MIALDTNVLVRHIVQDNPAQSSRATLLIHSALAKKEPIFVSVLVLCEIAWLFKSYYKFSKPHILMTLEAICQEEGFAVEERPQVLEAIKEYRHGSADFPDCLIGEMTRHRGCSTTHTFDHGLRQNSNFTVIR